MIQCLHHSTIHHTEDSKEGMNREGIIYIHCIYIYIYLNNFSMSCCNSSGNKIISLLTL